VRPKQLPEDWKIKHPRVGGQGRKGKMGEKNNGPNKSKGEPGTKRDRICGVSWGETTNGSNHKGPRGTDGSGGGYCKRGVKGKEKRRYGGSVPRKDPGRGINTP